MCSCPTTICRQDDLSPLLVHFWAVYDVPLANTSVLFSFSFIVGHELRCLIHISYELKNKFVDKNKRKNPGSLITVSILCD